MMKDDGRRTGEKKKRERRGKSVYIKLSMRGSLWVIAGQDFNSIFAT